MRRLHPIPFCLLFASLFLAAGSALAAVQVLRADGSPVVVEDVYQRDGVAFVAIEDVLDVLGFAGEWDNVAHLYRIKTPDGQAVISPGSSYLRFGGRTLRMDHRPRFIDGKLRVSETFLAEQFLPLLNNSAQIKNLNPIAPPPPESPLDELFSLLLLQRPKAAIDSQWVVAIDPGHGGQDAGAISRDGLSEQAVNLAVAQQLQKLLKMRRGAPVVMTRDADYAVSPSQRIETITRGQADVLLSLHAQSGFAPLARGVVLFIPAQTAALPPVVAETGMQAPPAVNASRQLAEALANAFLAAGYGVARIQERALLPLGQGDLPRVLVEMGYLTNTDDLARLRDPAQQQKLAQVLYSGLESFQKDFQHLQEAANEPELPATQQ